MKSENMIHALQRAIIEAACILSTESGTALSVHQCYFRFYAFLGMIGGLFFGSGDAQNFSI